MEQRRNAHPPFFKSVRNYFREYCNCSSIHGFRYFGEKRTYFERAWWFVVFSVTLAGCVIAIREVYQKWVRSPVIVSFATRETPIYSIPFPAVTICPEAKTRQDMYNHTSILRKIINKKELTKHEQKLYDYMGLICNRETTGLNAYSHKYSFDDDFFRELENIEHLYLCNYLSPLIILNAADQCKEDKRCKKEQSVYLEINVNSTSLLLPEAGIKANISYIPSITICSFMGKTYANCSKLFKPIITDEGICFTFNMLDRSEIFSNNIVHYENFHVMENLTYSNWSMDDGYAEDAGVYPYPHRALLSGAKNSLTVHLITSKSNIDHTCKEAVQGFRVPINQVVLGSIQPVMITTSESVMMYNAKRRECYFPSERKLKYFKIYTSLNCKLECLTNFTLNFCGCVNFYMPRENTTRICGIGKIDCMKMAEDMLQMGNLHKKIEIPRNDSTDNSTVKENKFYHRLPDCDCMPICTDLSYDIEISQNEWKWIDYLRVFSKNGSLPYKENDYHLSRLTLFFKSSQFITSQRHELYGPTDFLANFGGLLGLFTGFSILSLMEAIYFLTVRLCCNSRLYGYWAGQDTS